MKRFWAGALLAQFLLFFILSKVPAAVSFFEQLFEAKKSLHIRIFSGVPFSVGDVFYLLVIAVLIYYLFGIFRKKQRSSALLKLLILLNVFYFLYQIFWGMLYFQTPLSEQLTPQQPSTEELKKTATLYLRKASETRKLVQEDQNGVFRINSLSSLKSEIMERQSVLPDIAGHKTAIPIDAFKPSFYKSMISYTGIYGYYNPFTAEAQYNRQLPASQLPFTLAHESAHQMGFAREQEANFIGYLIGRSSQNPDLKYSTELYVLKSTLSALPEEEKVFVQQILDNYSPQMKRDREYELIFRKKHDGLLDVFFGFTNDLFLKSNQQEGSITYSYFVDLLIRYERNHP